MNKYINSIIIFTFLCIVPPAYSQWETDILGNDFESLTIKQGSDYIGTVVSTLIHRKTKKDSERGVLYIHGFNDFFFQKEMAEEFIEHGYEFYALDLRKYGRSIRNGQKPFQVRNLNEYFQDIDSALYIMTYAGVNQIVLMGHSTGGLISSIYIHQNCPKEIKCLILNSPFFDWNLGNKEWLIPIISAIGKFFPNLKIPQSEGVYSKTINKEFYGEWEYNTDWKKPNADIDAGWVRAINEAQAILKNQQYRIKIPILLMYSAESYYDNDWSEKAQESDSVLDVEEIKSIGLTLGKNVTPLKVVGGLHDLFLSSKSVRYPLYNYVFNWLNKNI